MGTNETSNDDFVGTTADKPDAPPPAERDRPGELDKPGELDEPAELDKQAEPAEPVEDRPEPTNRKIMPSRMGGLWAGLIVAAVVMILLLVFVLQNLETVDIDFLMLHGSLPLGVALLFAAISGILMVAIPGIGRMMQLRRKLRR